jgi:hypothetical protein
MSGCQYGFFPQNPASFPVAVKWISARLQEMSCKPNHLSNGYIMVANLPLVA